jgi:F-type H+-transporting ATPase subunit b
MLELAFIFLAEDKAGHGHAAVPALLHHEWGLIFWSAVTFGVVLFVLKKTAWGPILEGLEKRERTIADAIATAQKDRAEAAKVLEEHKKQLAKVRDEAQSILNETTLDAKRIVDEAHAKAAAEAEATRQRALRDIEMAKAKAVDELRRSSIDLALVLAEKVIGSEVNREKQRTLVEDFVKAYERN